MILPRTICGRLRQWIVLPVALLLACHVSRGPIEQEPVATVTVHGMVRGPNPGGVPGSATLESLELGCASGAWWRVTTPIGADSSYASSLAGPPLPGGYLCVQVQVPGQSDSIMTVQRDSVYFGDAQTDSIRIDITR